jgi:putative transposase
MDFVSDGLWNDRKFKVLTVLDIFTKECLAIEVDTSINGDKATRILDWPVPTKGALKFITTDNDLEFPGKALDKWVYNNNVTLDFIEPGKPIQNAFIESFNGRLRHECLNQHYFFNTARGKKDC